MLLEDWLADQGERPDPDLLPVEHRFMLAYWPEAFHYFRFSLFEYLERVIGLSPWNMVTRSVLAREREQDPEGFEALISAASDHEDRFTTQRRNAVHRYMESTVELNEGNLGSAVALLLTAYSHVYEIDLVLWFLGVMGRAHRESRFDPKAFGGPSSSTPQAALISQVAQALEGTPFENMFALSYDPALRNSIGHNSYEVSGEGTDIWVTDLNTGRKWHGKELNTLVLNSLQLVQAVTAAIGYTREVVFPRKHQEFRDCGLISLEGWLTVDGVPEITLLQLWCFRDIDPHGAWIDDATATIEPIGPSEERHSFTERAYLTGPPILGTDIGRAIQEVRWARVHRIPAAPNLDLGYSVFRRPDGAEYEILGPGDEHIVRFELPD